MTTLAADTTSQMVGHSARLKQVLRLAEKLGRGNWPVLILGETGTGKELVARTIHQVKPDSPFVTIDCSAMVGPLMESELFGHVKGAFTSASNAKTGLIEIADGGTAFFDEIGELPLDLQGKLLRVLQQKEFRPVGSTQFKKSSFRVIAATNRDLAAEVENNRFRQDLYYRLNVVTLRLSPLRERRSDIPALIDHFLRKYGHGHSMSGEVLEMMLAYEWPATCGNWKTASSTWSPSTPARSFIRATCHPP
jgi:transcriptional regulator with GAF, ATPase, and Fis domain